MKPLAVCWALAGIALIGVTASGQQVRETRAGYAACYDRGEWERQEAARSEPGEWAAMLRVLVRDERCWITGDGMAVEVVDSLEDAYRVRVESSPKVLWWVSVEAVR